MLKNIVIDETQQIIISNPEELKQEAEDRTHKAGPKTYLENLLKGKTRLRKNAGWYPEEKKIEVAALFAAGMVNSSDLHRLTGINAATIREWRTSDWWPEMLERIHVMHDEETVSKFTEIVDKSLETIQDRLINGEYVLNKKTGEVLRKPVAMRDVTAVASTIVDKRQLLRGKPTSRSEKVGIDERLLKLADEFRKFVAAKDVTKESIELVHDN